MPVVLTKKIHGNIAGVQDEIRERLRRNAIDSFVYIVPTKRKVRDLQREFLNSVPAKASPSFFLFTLETFAARLYSILSLPARFVSGPSQAVLVKQAIDSVAEKLRYIRLHGAQQWLPKGTFENIVNVINKFKESGVYPAQLYAELDGAAKHEQSKLRDILAIYEQYETILGDEFIDANGKLKRVNELWDDRASGNTFKFHFPRLDTIFVSGFDEFSDPELTLLHHVSEVNGITTIIEFDYHLDNDELFGHLKENYQKFLEMGFSKVEAVHAEKHQLQKNVMQYFFRENGQTSKLDQTEKITLADAPDRRAEAESIAKIIKRLAQQDPGLDLSKICVALYQPQNYTALFRETFERYGIPVNITDRFSLDQSPFVIALLALLDVQRNNFRLNDVMRALSSPYFLFGKNGSTVDAGNLFETALRLKITRGYRAWTERIEQELRHIADQLLKTEDDFEELTLRREEHELHKAKQDLEYLAELLRPFGGSFTPQELKNKLCSLMRELSVVDCILAIRTADVPEDQLEKDTRAYEKFLAFLDDFLSILALQEKGRNRQTLVFYAEQLRSVLAQIRYNIFQRHGYGVLVTSFEETRGLQFSVMILAGLIDGEFPPVYQPEIFFSEGRRSRLERYHLTKHRYLFYQALTNFSQRLYLIYPRKDGEIELVPSSFLDALQKIVTVKDWRGKLPAEFSEISYSEDELLLRYGAQSGNVNADKLRTVTLPDNVRRTLEHMNHTMDVERRRSAKDGALAYDGFIFNTLSEEAKQALERFRRKIFSVTQLETYGKCPFQYFANRVLRLNVVSEVEEGLTPLERGGLLHEILFDFYTGRRDRGTEPVSHASTDSEFQAALEELTSLARKKIDEAMALDMFSEVDKEIMLGSAERKGILRELLELERERNVDVRPAFFELAFGPKVGPQRKTDRSLLHEKPVLADNVQLRGKIDRVELGSNVFTVIDYKTGINFSKRKEIDLGIGLQLPLYLYAVEKILTEHGNPPRTGAAGIYFSLRSPVKEVIGIGNAEQKDKAFGGRSKQLVATDEELRAVIAQAIRFVNTYVDDIANGKFPVEPKLPEETCTYCDYNTVCRIQSRISLQQE